MHVNHKYSLFAIIALPVFCYSMDEQAAEMSKSKSTFLQTILRQLEAPKEAEMNELAEKVCSLDYAGGMEEKIRALGQQKAVRALLTLFRPDNSEQKFERLTNLAQANLFSDKLQIKLAHSQPDEDMHKKALAAMRLFAQAGADHLLALKGGPLLFSKGLSQNFSWSGPAQELFEDAMQRQFKVVKESYVRLSKISTCEEFAQSELETVHEMLSINRDALKKAIDLGCVRDYLSALAIGSETPEECLLDFQLGLDRIRVQLEPAREVDVTKCIDDGRCAAHLYILANFTVPDMNILQKRLANYGASVNFVKKITAICNLHNKNTPHHQNALKELTTFYGAFAKSLSEFPYNVIDFSKGTEQDLLIPIAHLKNNSTRVEFKNMLEVAQAVAQASSFLQASQILKDSEKRTLEIGYKFKEDAEKWEAEHVAQP